MIKNDVFYDEIVECENYMKLYDFQLKNHSELIVEESSVEQESDRFKFYYERFNNVM